MSRGALRRGEALLAGLLRCGHCGRKLHVAYSGTDGNTGRYHCQGGFLNQGGDRCISFGGMRIDRDVGAEVIERLQPLGKPRRASLAVSPKAHSRHEQAEPIDEADRAFATRTHITRQPHRQIGQMTTNRVRNAG